MIKFKKIVNVAILTSLLVFLYSCTKDFIVKDIKNALVSIIAPIDNLSSPNNTITFWWDELDGAEKYNLQIVKPNFNSVAQLILDTNITSTKFYKTLTPGTYQWRIKAINNGGSTAYVTRNLIIDTTSNLSLVSVNLITPLNYSVMANNSVIFYWNTLYAATSYELKLTNLATSSVTTISSIVGTSYTYSFSTINGTEEKYSWQIKAFNSFSQTLSNTVRSFKIDHKSPLAPNLNIPLLNATVKDTSFFRWNHSMSLTNNDIRFDSIFIGSYPDSTFLSPISIKAATISTINSYPIKPTLTSPTNTLMASPYYYWKVKSFDSVGNVSPASPTFKFKLQN